MLVGQLMTKAVELTRYLYKTFIKSLTLDLLAYSDVNWLSDLSSLLYPM